MAEADRPAWQEQTAAPVQEGAPTADAPPASPWRRRMLMFSAPLLLAVVGGYFWLTGGRYVSTDNAYVQQDKVAVSSDVSGRIVSVNVREDQHVNVGDILFRIDPEPYQVALAQAKDSIAPAQVDLQKLPTDYSARTEERRGGQECVSPCNSRWSP